MATTAGPSIEEFEKLSKFRVRVGKIYPESDDILLKWLRARDLDVVKAEQMLRRHLIWRKNNEVDNLATWRAPKVFFPYIHFGFDKDTAPVYLMPIGRWEMRAAIENGDIVPALRFIYQSLETIMNSCKDRGIYQGTVICDFDGFGYRQIAHRTVLQGILEVLRVFESNYPEVLKAAYVINAPAMFNYLFALVKPLLNSRTLSKVQIFGPNKPKWQEVLLKQIDADQIPPFWGGTKSGIDEFCSNDWFMEPLPPNFFRRASSSFDEFGEEWSTIKVPAREKVLLDFYAKSGSDTALKWSFRTDGYDVGFSVYYGQEEDYLVEYRRVNSQEESQEGFLNLDRSGKYTVAFDNTYSRTRAKTLHYCVSLVSLDTADENSNGINILNERG